MSIWKAALLGLLQGITSILPISSSGHVALLGHLMGESSANNLSFMALLHIGTLAGLLYTFRGELLRLIAAFLRIIRDCFYNLPIFLNHLQQPGSTRYRPLLKGNYARYVALLATALVPTLVVGLLIRPFARVGASNLLLTAMGFFVTALLLLVSSFTIPTKKNPRMTRFSDMLLIGLLQGVSVIPGMSRTGMTLAAAGMTGLTPSYRLRMTYMLAIPSIVGGLIFLLPSRMGNAAITAGPAACLVGILASAVSTAVSLHVVRRLLVHSQYRGFAVYSLLAGIVSVLVYFH